MEEVIPKIITFGFKDYFVDDSIKIKITVCNQNLQRKMGEYLANFVGWVEANIK